MKTKVSDKLEVLLTETVLLKEKLFKFLGVGHAVGKSGDEEEDFIKQVQKAHRDWEIAVNNFNYASEPDLVDYYIYDMEAAEKKYIYYIKRARKENIESARPVKDICHEGKMPARCP